MRCRANRRKKTVTIWSQYGVSPCATTRVWGSIPPTSTNITHYNSMADEQGGGIMPPHRYLYKPMSPNNTE
jgi:hypothetical protein